MFDLKNATLQATLNDNEKVYISYLNSAEPPEDGGKTRGYLPRNNMTLNAIVLYLIDHRSFLSLIIPYYT